MDVCVLIKVVGQILPAATHRSGLVRRSGLALPPRRAITSSVGVEALRGSQIADRLACVRDFTSPTAVCSLQPRGANNLGESLEDGWQSCLGKDRVTIIIFLSSISQIAGHPLWLNVKASTSELPPGLGQPSDTDLRVRV
jgi:hypothetical protein